MQSSSLPPRLPNEIWGDILRYLPVDALWFSTRPVCTLFYHVSTSLVKSVLVEGSSCQLRHYISFRDSLLREPLEYPREQSEYHRRILEQEGHSAFSQILLWSSPCQSLVNPRNGPGIPTVNYESADGKKCVTMAVFGGQASSSGSTNGFHCRRTGCRVTQEESAGAGHACLAGCWHVHYSPKERRFCATIPLAILLPIYLRLLEAAKRQNTMNRSYASRGKNRWPGRHGVSASVSPIQPLDDINAEAAISVDGDDTPMPVGDWSDEDDGGFYSLIRPFP
jgi:hypothetical protein